MHPLFWFSVWHNLESPGKRILIEELSRRGWPVGMTGDHFGGFFLIRSSPSRLCWLGVCLIEVRRALSWTGSGTTWEWRNLAKYKQQAGVAHASISLCYWPWVMLTPWVPAQFPWNDRLCSNKQPNNSSSLKLVFVKCFIRATKWN